MSQFRVETITERCDGKMWMNKELTGKKFHRFRDMFSKTSTQSRYKCVESAKVKITNKHHE